MIYPELQKAFDRQRAEFELHKTIKDAEFQMLEEEYLMEQSPEFIRGWNEALEWVGRDATETVDMSTRHMSECDRIIEKNSRIY